MKKIYFIILFISYYSILNASPIKIVLHGNLDGIPLQIDNIKNEKKTYFSINKDKWNISSFGPSTILQKLSINDLDNSDKKNSIYLKVKYKF